MLTKENNQSEPGGVSNVVSITALQPLLECCGWSWRRRGGWALRGMRFHKTTQWLLVGGAQQSDATAQRGRGGTFCIQYVQMITAALIMASLELSTLRHEQQKTAEVRRMKLHFNEL